MSGSSRETLLSLLASTYPELKRRLTRRLGSPDRAQDALHDTFVRLQRAEIATEIRNPKAYILTTATHIASNSARKDTNHLSTSDLDRLLETPDEAPNPARAAEARSELAVVEQALQDLPPRRRAIFRRYWIEEASYKELALEFSLSERSIRNEVLLASRHVHQATEEFSVEALQEQLARVSSK